MKKTARILALVMAAVLAVFALTACGDDEKKKENASTPEGVVKTCIESVLKADFEKAISFVSKDCPGYKDMEEITDIDAMLEKDDLGEKEKKFVKFVYDKAIELIPEIGSVVKYEVHKATISGDKATVVVDLPGIINPDYEPSAEFQGEIMGVVLKNSELMSAVNGEMPDLDKLSDVIEKVIPGLVDAVKAELGRATTAEVTVELVKQGNAWKISGIENF